jgi:hypothetical protein
LPIDYEVPFSEMQCITVVHCWGRATSPTFFDSPALAANQDFVYTIKASWMENGKTVNQERQINVHSGQNITVISVTATATTFRLRWCRARNCSSNRPSFSVAGFCKGSGDGFWPMPGPFLGAAPPWDGPLADFRQTPKMATG